MVSYETMARHNEIGKLGEELSCRWLSDNGFEVIERNYLRKWGEIDIVARETAGILHFIEVKTVSYETKAQLEWAVSHETWRPEDNVHKNKQNRLKRAIQTWISGHNYVGDWKIDIVVARVVPREMFAQIKFLENIVFE